MGFINGKGIVVGEVNIKNVWCEIMKGNKNLN